MITMPANAMLSLQQWQNGLNKNCVAYVIGIGLEYELKEKATKTILKQNSTMTRTIVCVKLWLKRSPT